MNRTLTNLLPELPMATGENTFKNNIQPANWQITETIGRDAKQVTQLTPPVFEDATAQTRAKQRRVNKLILSLIKVK